MLIKRAHLVTSLLCFTGLAFAGGPTPMETPTATPASPSQIYVQAQVGYGMRNWQDFDHFGDIYAASGASVNAPSFTRGNGGLAWGLGLGYQWNQSFALEVNYVSLSNTEWTDTNTLIGRTTNISGSIQTWLVNAAIKFSYQLSQNLQAYAKLGGAYVNDEATYKTITGATTNNFNLKDNHFGLLASIGASFDLCPSVYLGAQYTYITGNSSSPSSTQDFRSPSINLIMATLGYRF